MTEAPAITARLVSIQVGQPQLVHPEQVPPLRTALGKKPVTGPVRLESLGLEGDAQADQRFHGGPEKAVLCYSADHYAGWSAELQRPGMPWGFFGENFSVSGLTEADVCLGDVFTLGMARVRVTQPREPCYKLSRYWQIDDLEERARTSGRTGWYLAVEAAGPVEAGEMMRLVERPAPEWPIARVNFVMHVCQQDRAATLALAACPHLAARWRQRLTSRAQRLSQGTLFSTEPESGPGWHWPRPL